MPEGWQLEEIVVLGLASNRLARAVAVDEVSSPLRRGVRRWAAARPDDHLASWLAQLVSEWPEGTVVERRLDDIQARDMQVRGAATV